MASMFCRERVGTPAVTGVPVKLDVEKLLSYGLMGFCLYS